MNKEIILFFFPRNILGQIFFLDTSHKELVMVAFTWNYIFKIKNNKFWFLRVYLLAALKSLFFNLKGA